MNQCSKTCTDFIQATKSLVNQLALVGKLVEEGYLIHPLYNPFITSYSFAAKDNFITLEEIQSELLGYEQMFEQQNTLEPASFVLYSHKKKKNFKPRYGANNSSKPPPGVKNVTSTILAA